MPRSSAAVAPALALLVASAQAQMQSSSSQTTQNNATIAHGILMGLAFAVLFPFGSTILRLFRFKGVVWIHGGWQLFAYVIALAGFGLGVWLAVETQQLVANGHAIIGIIVISVLLVQPLLGIVAHWIYKKRDARNAHKRESRVTGFGVTHRWVGRVFLVLGAINGGLGLQLSGNTVSGEIAYGVLAGFFFLLWFIVVVWRNMQAKRSKTADSTVEPKQSLDSAANMSA